MFSNDWLEVPVTGQTAIILFYIMVVAFYSVLIGSEQEAR
jgi:hypothetical protein